MPSRALSAKELMEHGTRGTNEQRAASRAARALAQLSSIQHNAVRDQSCAQQVCVCISVLLRHLAVPPKLLLLDLLLASYLVLRAGDERGTVLRLGGGKVSLHLMQSCWGAVNPFYYREVGGNNVFLSFEEALRCLNLHPVQKDGNPFRGDPFADALRAYWSNPHAGLSVAAMFLAVVFILSTRSKILLQFFVAHPDADLTDLSILPKLYDLALQHGPQLGDAGTVHAAATSLGNLIDSILLPYWRQPQEHPVTALVQCRRIRDARELLMQIPHFGELAMAHVFSYIAAMDKGLQRLSWSQQKLPDAQLPLAANARAWLALRRAGRELTKSPGWLEEEARNWVQTMQAMMPKTVTYRRHSDGVEVEWKPQITRSLCQANSCKSLQVLQTWLSGMLGNHGRKSAADMLPSWRRKRWGPKRKRSQG